MAVENIPISQLPEASTASDSDVLAIDNGTTTYKITVENFNATGTASAQAAAAAAAASATAASESATAALGYKNTVESALNDASTIVSNAQTYANSAESSKNDASGYASAASTSASQAATSASQAASYATGVQEYATEAKSWAQGGTGTRVDEETTNCAYYANSAHTSETNASTSASNAATSESNAATSAAAAAASEASVETNALKAEGYAVGTQNGTAAESGEPYYQDNAKYYKEQAADSATYADGAATIADTKAGQASLSASEAKESEEDSEAWAWGKIDGVDVPATHPAYHNNAKYWADAASGGASGGVTSFNGRSGIVVPAAHDYSAYAVDFDNTSNNFTAADVQEAIEEVQGNVNTLSGSLATVATTGAYSDLSGNPTLGSAAAKDSTNSVTQNSTDLVESGAVYTETKKAYQTGDSAETAIVDNDYIPFYDTSASGKRKSLWSNIKSVLKTYFDTLYKGISVHDAWSEVTSKPFSTVGSGLTVTSDTVAADVQSVTVGTTGTASDSAASYQRIGVNGSYTEISGTKYMETSTYTTSGNDRVFTFSNVPQDAVIDGPYCDVIGVAPTGQTHSGTTYTASFATSDAVGKVRIYLK